MPTRPKFGADGVYLIWNQHNKGIDKETIAQQLGVVRGTVRNCLNDIRRFGVEVAASRYETRINGGSVKRVTQELVGNMEPIVRTSQEDWWRKYDVLHDDGSQLRLRKLPDKVLCFGDMQAPEHHPDTLPFLSAVIARHDPDEFICMGDEADLTGLKKAYMTHESLGPTQELERAIEFMHDLFKIVPRAVCLTSNHVKGRMDFAQAQGNIPNVMMRMWSDVVGAPRGWIWRDYLLMGRWFIEHGHSVTKGSRASLDEELVNRFNVEASVMRGHRHGLLGDAMVPKWKVGDWQQRLVYTGCLMKPASYTRAAQLLGCVVLDKGTPHVIKMQTDIYGKWTGKLIEGDSHGVNC
jgi:hypothetical protein